jgi:hypothetical protein
MAISVNLDFSCPKMMSYVSKVSRMYQYMYQKRPFPSQSNPFQSIPNETQSSTFCLLTSTGLKLTN